MLVSLNFIELKDGIDISEYKEVLCVNGYNDFIVGYLNYNKSNECWECEDDHTILSDITHFAVLPKIN